MQNRCLNLFISHYNQSIFASFNRCIWISNTQLLIFFYQQNPNGLTKVTISGHGWQKYHRFPKKGKNRSCFIFNYFKKYKRKNCLMKSNKFFVLYYIEDAIPYCQWSSTLSKNQKRLVLKVPLHLTLNNTLVKDVQ